MPVTNAFEVLNPTVFVTSIVSPIANGDSTPLGNVKVVPWSDVVIPTKLEATALSLRIIEVSAGTNILLSVVADALVPTSINESATGVTLR